MMAVKMPALDEGAVREFLVRTIALQTFATFQAAAIIANLCGNDAALRKRFTCMQEVMASGHETLLASHPTAGAAAKMAAELFREVAKQVDNMCTVTVGAGQA